MTVAAPIRAPRWCGATVNYASPDGMGAGLVPADIDVHDARQADLPGWDACGFVRVDDRSAVDDWTDDDEIAAVHYAEAEAVVRRVTGCDAALVSDHVKRSAVEAKRRREQDPVRLVHSDFAANYEEVVRTAYRDVRGRGRATLERVGLTSEHIESASRLVMVQLWRNLGEPRMDLPVAWCDARSVSPTEGRPFLYRGYVAGGREFDALAIARPDDPRAHHWYAFPDLRADEVVVFRTYDTDLVRAGETWFTPHTAFRDPAVELGRPPRFSIELRVLALFA